MTCLNFRTPILPAAEEDDRHRLSGRPSSTVVVPGYGEPKFWTVTCTEWSFPAGKKLARQEASAEPQSWGSPGQAQHRKGGSQD